MQYYQIARTAYRSIFCCTVNRLNYRKKINDFLWPDLYGLYLDNIHFQQDDDMYHSSNETNDLFGETFPDRVLTLEEKLAIDLRDLMN